MLAQPPSTPNPFLAAVHAWHVPVQVASQQTPSVQKPLMQSVALPQIAPLGLRFVHELPRQV